MNRVITIANRKGGIGKTTTTTSMASCLRQKNFRVLMIDLDSQCNLSSNVNADVKKKTVLDVLLRKCKASDAIQATSICDIIPGSLELSKINDSLANKTGREYRLLESLFDVKDDYDYCIIDTPPELALATTNALTASDQLIIPTTAESFSLDGIEQLYSSVKDVWSYTNKDLQIAGILITLYNSRAVLSKAMRKDLEQIAYKINTKLYKQTIRRGIAIAEAQTKMIDLFEYAPNSDVAKDYATWVEEYLEDEKNA